MKAFVTLQNEIWCMDLEYVVKLAKDKKGVMYLIVRRDLFDRTVDAKGMKTKMPKNGSCIFDYGYKKRTVRKKFEKSTRDQNLLGSLKLFAKLKEYKFTPE